MRTNKSTEGSAVKTKDQTTKQLDKNLFPLPAEEKFLEENLQNYPTNIEDESFLRNASQTMGKFTYHDRVNFLNNRLVQKAFYDVSLELFSNYQDNFVFALGQSPAWFLTMAQLQYPESKDQFRPVAFSGDWYGIYDSDGKELVMHYAGERTIPREEGSSIDFDFWKLEGTALLKEMKKNKPTDEQTGYYREYLSRIGCSPLDIMKREKATVIMDYVVRAGGLKSFLEFLFDWAENEGIDREIFKRKIQVSCLYQTITPFETYTQYMNNNLGKYSSSPIDLF